MTEGLKTAADLRSRLKGQHGVSLLEFAAIASVLAVILIAATDYGLSILARQEIQGAARAGAEFASERGYNVFGIREAAICSRGTETKTVTTVTYDKKGNPVYNSTSTEICTPFRFHTNTVVKVNQALPTDLPRPTCVCRGDFYAGSPAGIQGDGSYTCKTLPKCDGGSVTVERSAFAEVTVSGSYSPLFPWLGWSGNSNFPLTAKSVVKTFLP